MKRCRWIVIISLLVCNLLISACITINQYPLSTSTLNQEPTTLPAYPTVTLPTPKPMPPRNMDAPTELKSVQSAVKLMMTALDYSTLPITRDSGNATANMTIFPGLSPYSLWFNTGKGVFVNYFATSTTRGTYAVDTMGTVSQVTTGY